MKNPLITVIIPVYNVEKYLRRCLDSVIAQTYQNLEIICVDDGSIDDSGKICDQYAVRDARIKVIHQENQGLSAARNRGLDCATGEYIAFVDSDDYIQSDMLERLYSELSKSEASYVICGYNVVNSAGIILGTHSVGKNRVCSGADGLRQHYYHSNGQENFVTVWGKLYNKELFADVRFKAGIYFEDIHIMPYLLLQSSEVLLLPYVGYSYTQNEHSITNTSSETHRAHLYKNAFEIWKDHIELYKRCGLPDLENAIYCACISKVIAHSLSNSIPNGMERESLALARQYIKKVIWRSRPPIKQKLYYALFCLLGPNVFKLLAKARDFRRSKPNN